ncbi:EAL domain-containing protein [Caminibacter mediatlanticus TB-2]|uniref:EAL domain-containing protein n=1 Tax=Caminibacter mediatlanticus TB-2 TaxID=391592 RepID=A0ABX5V8B2_9BACT|nr:EAL domain-containing protein [Caminibacter mediatlanticus]QCT94513.1 EAL domain-containing protein [Caminibacter mediatlanticus TB-2]
MLEENQIIENIFPVYQAIIDINKSSLHNNKYEIIKYEALLRSKLNNKTIYPNEILNNSNINKRDITKNMFLKILDDIKKYKINISFNISISDLLNKKLIELIYSSIDDTIENNKIAKFLTFEFIEEEEIMANKIVVKEFIKNIHMIGSKVALDDFGKGYATFGPLIEFEFDIIKLDEILVKNFLQDPKKYYLLDTLINMFNKLGIKVVAEYIERVSEFNSAQYIGCHYGQGYCIAKPQTIINYFNNNIERECLNDY